MKIIKYLSLYVILPLAVFVVGAFVGSALLISFGKEISDNSNWFDSPNGIDESAFVTLGEHEHFVRIRGRDKTNPVLVYVHGGPGGAQTGTTYRILRPLTEFFTLVEWDQRGAGRSIGDDQSLVSTMSYERLVDDAVELIEHVQNHLDVEKVVLLGHSWGSMLGLGIIQKRPDLISSYVGVGQLLAWNNSWDETARLALAAAEDSANLQAAESLRGLPNQWPPREDYEANLERILKILAPLAPMGKSFHAAKEKNVFKSEFIVDRALSPQEGTSLLQIGGQSEATKRLVEDLYGRDMREELGYEYKVPIFIFHGEHDWHTPVTLVKPWFAKLSAPSKQYIPFEDSAHIVIIEQPGKLLYELVSKVRPLAQEVP